MSGTSSVGQASVYEAGDQRNSKESETKPAERYHEGQKNSHLANDSSTFPPPLFPFFLSTFYLHNPFSILGIRYSELSLV